MPDVAAVDEDGHVLAHVAVLVQDLPVQLGAKRYQPPQQLADKSARRQGYLKVALTGPLPQRFLKEPSTSKGSAGQVCELDLMLREYYEARGWENGVVPERKLKELAIV